MEKPTLKIFFKTSFPFKVFTGLFVTGLFLGGAYFYIKASLVEWCQEQKLEVSVKGMHLHWHHVGIPGVSFEEVNVKNNDPKASTRHIKAKNLSIQPYFFALFQNYLTGYKFILNIENLKIDLKSQDSIEGDKVTSDIRYKGGIYEIDNFKVEPLRVRLGPASTTRMDNGEINKQGAHLIIYQIIGEAQYLLEKNLLHLYLQVPRASQQMPEGKTYSIQAKGGLTFVKSHQEQDPGARGKIKFTIDGFSNFLRHLYQAQIISGLVKDLGSIIGYPMSREDLFSHQKEIFTNAISLDLIFHQEGFEITSSS